MKLKDLKRGMRVTYRNGTVLYVDYVRNGTIFYLERSSIGGMMCSRFRNDLTNVDSDLDIMKVEDITSVGYLTIWERAETKLYTLSLPNCSFQNRYLEISLEDNTRYRFKRKPKHNKPHVVKDYLDNKVVETYISVFTDEDIRNISNSKLINLLNKEVFEEEREVELYA